MMISISISAVKPTPVAASVLQDFMDRFASCGILVRVILVSTVLHVTTRQTANLHAFAPSVTKVTIS